MTKEMTLTLDAGIADFAQNLSEKTHKPLSKIVEEYLSGLRIDTEHRAKARGQAKNYRETPREVAELYGILEDIDVPDKKEMRRMFHEDHI